MLYTDLATVRAMPELLAADPAPTDDELTERIEQAEDQIDEWLGMWSIDPTTGRKIVQADIEPWRWAKLDRATARLAARLVANPGLLEPEAYDEVAGPDFRRKGPRSPTARGRLADVVGPLNASGLRILSARARA